MNDFFLRSVLRVDFGRIAAQGGLLFGQIVHLFVEVSDETVFAGTAIVSDGVTLGVTCFRCRLHNHYVPPTEKSGQAALRTARSQRQRRTVPHLYSFNVSDIGPKMLGSCYTGGFYR